MNNRKPFDLDDYIQKIQNGPCFICEMLAGRLQGNHVIYQNELFIAFLNKFPTLYGYALVAPVAHKEQVTGDFTLDEYLALQRGIHHRHWLIGQNQVRFGDERTRHRDALDLPAGKFMRIAPVHFF